MPSDVSSCNIKVPFKVTMDICGSFTVQVLEAEDYSLEVADKEFAGYLKDAVLDAFVVSKSNDSGVAILDVSMNLDADSDFKGEIVTQLQRALMNVSGDNLEIYLKDWANTELLADLRANGMAAALEGDGINELAYDDLEGSYEAGAAALWDGLVALPPQKRSLIATQIPNKNWMAARNGFDNDDDQHHHITFLPLRAGGDSMTFQFQIEQHFSVSTEAMPNYSYDGSPNTDNIATGTSAYAGHLVDETTYGVEKRIVNIVLTRAAPKDFPDVSGESPYTVPDRDTDVVGSKSVNDLSGEVNSAQTAFDTASDLAESSYQTWKAENITDISYNLHVSRKNVADAKFVAAKAALVKALLDLSGNPSSLSLKAAAELAKSKVEAAQADADSYLPLPSEASDLAGKLSTSKEDASAAAAAHRLLVAAKIALAAGEAKLAQEINKANELQEKYDALYESAQDASGESGEIWTDASGHVAELTTELETLVSDLSGARSEAHLAYLDASGAAAAAAADPADATKVQADIDAKVALAEKRAAFLAAKAAAESKLADLSGSIATANLKLADYALFYVYASGVDAASVAANEEDGVVTLFYNARERSVPEISAELLDEDLSNAN